ncbi:MAG: DUF502 domain-containing protein [Dehalococcoidia bacterium]|jgi:uncharacterized membrane protein|nr:MAG: DUF502 domain-containing protein [Dehalococcoidia bacterium]
MDNIEHKSGSSLGKKIRAQFITGIALVVPVGATVWIFIWIFTTIDNILQPLIRAIWGDTIPGVGFGITVVLVYLIGLVASNVVGHRLIRYVDSLLSRVPVFRQLYTGIRQVVQSFSAPDKTGFMQVVLVEFPRKDMRAIAFVTNEFTDKCGGKLLSVLIPTSPNPTTGFLEIVREEEVVRTRMTVDDAIKMIVSAGRMAPAEVTGKIPAA